jgi:hypothetical protein
MKLHVLHDAKGQILAAVKIPADPEKSIPRPVARRGQKSVVLDVPKEHHQSDLGTICSNHRVDVKRQILVAKPSKKQKSRARL